MKTTLNTIVVFIILLLSHWKVVAQNPEEYPYLGGTADGSSLETIENTTCSTPYHFFAYMGGNADGSAINDDLTTNTSCAFSNHFYAYMGGDADGSAIETIENTTCGTPFHFFAYMGSDADGSSVETIEQNICSNPPQFYAYFGGDADGFSRGETPQICPTDPPVADFTASAVEICEGDSVTFTDTSINYPGGWNWTFDGGTPNNSTEQNPTVTYNSPGVYNVTLVATNFNGNDTETKNGYIIVYEMPTITSVTGGSSCGPGSITLSATASTGSVRWYDAPTGGNLLGTTATPSTYQQYFAETTTYYVTAINGVCESAQRIPVTATVTNVPTLSSTTAASRCGSGSVTLQATATTGTIRWFDSASGGTILATGGSFVTPLLTSTTPYYVEVANGTCNSPRTEVYATINEVPTITSTTPSSRCDAGTVTLEATASNGTINWYSAPTGGTLLASGNSFTTPSISTTTTYYVEVTDGTCTSTRTAIIATVNNVPTITSTTPASSCGAASVTLYASTNQGTINWYNVPTGGTALATGTSFTTPLLTETTTYYVDAIDGSCGSSVRTEVVATINEVPTIVSTTSGYGCNGAATTITAIPSPGASIVWYTVNTTNPTPYAYGNSITVSGASFTYIAEAYTPDGCRSVRSYVSYTNVPTPIVHSVSPASRCGSGTLTLTASVEYFGDSIEWYSTPTGGSPIATGNTFVTPILTQTTNYYAAANNSTCGSGPRILVTATIYDTPSVTNVVSASRCGDGQVTLQATSDYGTLYWYDAPTGGTLIATGSTYYTPILGTTTTYYVEAINGTCPASSPRTPITATIYTMPAITSTTPDSRCDIGTLTLFATSDNGTLNWFDSPTGGTLLGTGNSFTTPTISSTTTYYVEATNGDCTTSRVPVVATISPTNAPNGNSSQTFCSGETVELIVLSGTGIIWYDSPSGGNIIPTGTPIANGVTYYASQTVSGCESPTRFAVTMTLGGCLGNNSFNDSELIIYPNPVEDLLNISYSEELSKVEIITILGQIVYSKKLSESSTRIDFSRYSTATYIVRIYDINNNIKTVKIIKK